MKHEPTQSGTQATRQDIDIRVINLERAKDRRQWMERQMVGLDRPWSFFKAHTALINPRLEFDADKIRGTYGRDMSGPQLALWSSHYTLIEEFLTNSDNEFLLVFEDDVMFDVAFPLDDLLTYCQSEDVHYMRLFGMYYARGTQLSYFFDRSIIRFRSSPSGTQAYVVSKEGARRLVETLRNVDTSWDLALDQFWRTGVPLYAVYPFPALERFSPSSVPIQDNAGLAFSDRIRFFWTRARNKVSKAFENRRLAKTDKAMQVRGRRFVQVGPDPVQPAHAVKP